MKKIILSLSIFSFLLVGVNHAWADITITSVKINNKDSVTIIPDSNLSISVSVNGEGNGENNDWASTSWDIISDGVGPVCVNTADHTWGGNNVESFNINAPSTTGTYSLIVRVYRHGNCNTERNSITKTNSIIVQVSDTTAPSTSITSPTNGSLVSGTINITANASDNVGVSKVEFWHSSPTAVKIGEDTTSPYSISFDTTTVSDGVHSLWSKAFDAAGLNSVSSLVSITVDNTVPTINLPSDITEEATSPAGAVVTFTAPSATDVNPVSPMTTCDYNSGDTFAIQTTTVNCKAKDDAGNEATGSFIVIVQDTTLPTITAPEDQTFEATGPNDSYSLTPATATDIADANLTIDYSPKTFGLGENLVTWTATDDAGLVASTTSKVTITDKTAPIINVESSDSIDTWINESFSEPNCSAVDLVDGELKCEITSNDVDTGKLGTYHIIYKALDKTGNLSEKTIEVNVIDKNKPIIFRIGLDKVIEGGSTYTDEGATAEDKVGNDITGDIVVTGLPIDTLILGLHEIFYNVTDLWGTSATTAKRNVTVQDHTAPVITVDPLSVTLLVGDTYDKMAGVTVSDLIDKEIVITTGGTYTGTESAGEYTVTYDAVDDSGNNATQVVRIITIKEPDRVPPTITSVEAVTSTSVVVTFDEELQNNPQGHNPNIEDFYAYNDVNKSNNRDEGDSSYGIDSVSYSNKQVTITLTNQIKAGDTPRLYIIPELTSLVDLSGNYYNNGNSDDKKINDIKNPVVTLLGDSTVNINVGDTYVDEGATASDNVDGDITSKIEIKNNVNTAVAGQYLVTYDVSDTAGNEADQVARTVNVNETERQITGSYIQGYSGMGLGQVLGAEKFMFTKLLKMWMFHDEEVTELQKRLTSLGIFTGPIDGTFGPFTRAGVMKFQKDNGLIPDGIVGPLTRAVLNK